MTSISRLRFALIGTGDFGPHFAPHINEAADLVAICDPHPQSRADFAKQTQLQLPEYDHHEQLLAEVDIDAAVEIAHQEEKNPNPQGEDDQFFDDLKEDDIILSFNSKKIKLIQDWFGELSKVKPGKKIHLEIKRNSKSFSPVVETVGFSEYLIRYRKLAQALCKNNQTKTDLFMKEFTENDYQSLPIERIEEIQNMDLEDKLEEKSKHEVRFDFFFRDKNNKLVMRDVEDSQDTEPRIKGVHNAGESYGHLEINDLILSINGNPIKTISDYIKEKIKLKWGQEVTFEIERKGKILKKYVTPTSFEIWKEKKPQLGIDVLPHKKKYEIYHQARPHLHDDNELTQI